MDLTQLVILLFALVGIAVVAAAAIVPTALEIPASVHRSRR